MSDNQTKFISERRVLKSVCRKISLGNIDLFPAWQRNVVWNTKMQRDLIMTILKGFPINPIVVWQIDNGNGTKEVCVDGKNRLSAIIDFVNNKFTVKFEDKDVEYKDLPPNIKDNFDDENLDIRILIGSYWNETKVREYFQVIQGGSKLTWPEIINAFNNKFVDFMRDIMISHKDYFAKVLGDDCNNRFELYNIIANVLSVHPLIYSQYKSAKSKLRTADTNKSLMKYVMNFEDFDIDEQGAKELSLFIIKTIDVVDALQKMQNKHITPSNKSIWYLTEIESNPIRIKPGIRDFTSIAYYITLNQPKDLDKIIQELKCIFKKFVDITMNSVKYANVMYLVRDYYITYGKNQKQYAWTSVSNRYDIMQKVLKLGIF